MEDYSDSNTTNWNGTLKSASSDWRRPFTEPRRVRWLAALEDALERFSPGERLALYLLATLLCLSALYLVARVDAAASVIVPAPGGSLTEGETGPARFINPLLATSQADQDLTALVYSGLMRHMPDGSLAPDLAESYSISSDGRTYTFRLRPNATFQDGTKVTSADVVYTVMEAQDPGINSPEAADWMGVAVSAPDPETVVFTLPKAYAPFLYDTTLGILPAHLWSGIPDEEFPFSSLNTHPVGSGPYKIAKVQTDSTGAAVRYDLSPFSKFTLGAPYLSRISFVFFQDDASMLSALNAGSIDAIAGLSPDMLSSVTGGGVSAVAVPLPRTFGVFFNQSHNPVLADSAVRAALSAATDRAEIVQQSLSGMGAILTGPIPPGALGNAAPAMPAPLGSLSAAATSSAASATLASNARALLSQGGWSWNGSAWTKGKQTLSFTLSTADQPQLVATAHELASQWQAAGVQVSVQVYPLAQLNGSVIAPRQYDALLFGEVEGPQLDLYAFWDSTQRSDPGLNLALYTNAKADALLSQARATTNTGARDALYQQFADLLQKDQPAVFLYAPDFIYLVPDDVSGIALGSLANPGDRFDNAYQWYVDTQYVWSVFAPKQSQTN